MGKEEETETGVSCLVLLTCLSFDVGSWTFGVRRSSFYCIRLLTDSGYISKTQSASLLKDCEELQKIIGAIKRTIKSRNS